MYEMVKEAVCLPFVSGSRAWWFTDCAQTVCASTGGGVQNEQLGATESTAGPTESTAGSTESTRQSVWMCAPVGHTSGCVVLILSKPKHIS